MILEKQIEAIYRSRLFVRKDNQEGIFYYSPEDYPGLQVHPYSFPAAAGHTLRGFFYHYPNPIPGRLLVFDHGLGNGHRAYMPQIQRLAKGGFLVFCYDHTGCMASGGENTNGFAQSLNDLDTCLKVLKQEPALRDRSLSVIGHSWGGFSTMNISAFHPDITHVVSMCGFINVLQMQKQNVRGLLALWRPFVYDIEQRANPEYVGCDALQTLRSTQSKVLLIYSDDDHLVEKRYHYDPLLAALSGQKNIRLHLEKGKGHDPYYTADAVRYKKAFFEKLDRLTRKGALSDPEKRRAFMDSFDWDRMTAQDDRIWDMILDHLKQA